MSSLLELREVERGAPVLRLFDELICRVAGLPVRVMEDLRATRAKAAVDEILRLDEALATASPALVDALFAAIGGTRSRKLRGALLEIKRDVHNLRPVRRSRVDLVLTELPPAVARDLGGYLDLAERLQTEIAGLADRYAADLAAARARLQSAVTDSDFQKGLLLSSRALHAGLERYAAADPDRLGAKERQIERGLLRYFSRMTMKTSPFSAFTGIARGRFDRSPGALVFEGDPRAKTSLVRLNKRIFAVLRQELRCNAAVRERWTVELNPTLRHEGDQWLFLSAIEGREVFQRMPRSPVLDLFERLLEEAGKLPCGELRSRVGAVVDASPEEVEAYTDRLLEVGFLRFSLGISEQEVDWDRPLCRFLAAVDDDEAREVTDFLTRLRRIRDAYGDAPVTRRRQLIDEAASAIKASYDSLRQSTGMRADVPFYEDAGTAATLHVGRQAMAGLEDDLVDYVRFTRRVSWPRHEHAAMRHFFDSFYGDAPERSVSLLRFYEDYYREHFKEHLRRERAALAAARQPANEDDPDAGYDLLNPFGLDIVERIKRANDGLTQLLRERWLSDPRAEQITLDRQDLETAVAGIPEPADLCFSLSLFVQHLPGFGQDGAPALLISNYLAGFGKYYSRFLDVLAPEVHSAVLGNNDRLTDHYLAEICGDGSFNANLHPRLVPWSLSYPSGDGGEADGQLLTADLDVERAPGDGHALCLRHRPSGRRVIPLDLGFQNPKTRPPLFQLLSSLAPASNYYLQVPETPVVWDEKAAAESAAEAPAEGAAKEPEIVYRPRISYRGRLIIARRRWTVPADVFPRRLSAESDHEYFLRANRWRRRHGIPEQAFLSIRVQPVLAPAVAAESDDGEETPSEPRAAAPRIRDHLHKPQYVDFGNPLLVDLMGRAAWTLERFNAYFFERLPGHEHLARAGGERYVTEQVIQLDCPQESCRGEGT